MKESWQCLRKRNNNKKLRECNSNRNSLTIKITLPINKITGIRTSNTNMMVNIRIKTITTRTSTIISNSMISTSTMKTKVTTRMINTKISITNIIKRTSTTKTIKDKTIKVTTTIKNDVLEITI